MPEMSTYTTLPFQPRTRGDIGGALMRQSRLAVVCFLALAAGAVAAVLMATPSYRGQMKILVKQDRADSVVSGAPDPAATRSDLSETELLSQVELIRADDVLENVATEAGLAKRMMASGRPRDDAEALALATESLRRDLIVAPIKRTWLIDVTYKSEDPHLARHVLDTLLRIYLEKHLALHRPAGTHRFFSEQSERARQELDVAQQRLEQFSQINHVVSAEQEKAQVLQKLAEFDGMRAQAATALAETNRRLSAISAELSRVPAQRTSEVRTSDDAGVMRDISSRILALELKRTELLQKFTPEYRGVVEIDGQLREARAALTAARNAPLREETVADNPTRQWLDTELARTQAEQEALRARVQALSEAVQDYRAKAQLLERHDVEQKDLARNLKAAEDKYLLYVQKREEARISDELDRTRIANVVVAQAPSVAYQPERSPSLASLPLLLGASLILSLAFALVMDGVAPWFRRAFAVRLLEHRLARNRALLDALTRVAPGLEKHAAALAGRPVPLEGH